MCPEVKHSPKMKTLLFFACDFAIAILGSCFQAQHWIEIAQQPQHGLGVFTVDDSSTIWRAIRSPIEAKIWRLRCMQNSTWIRFQLWSVVIRVSIRFILYLLTHLWIERAALIISDTVHIAIYGWPLALNAVLVVDDNKHDYWAIFFLFFGYFITLLWIIIYITYINKQWPFKCDSMRLLTTTYQTYHSFVHPM